MTNFLITLTIAVISGLTAMKLKVPGGAILGAILGVTVLNSCTTVANFPSEIKVVSTSLIGAFVGCNVSRQDLKQMKTLGKPIVLMVAVMLIYNLISSTMLTVTSDIDFTTAFLAMAPGGIADMSLVAMNMGANAPTVTTIQMFRLILVIAISPAAIKRNITYFRKRGYSDSQLTEQIKNNFENIEDNIQNKCPMTEKSKNIKLGITLTVSLIAGYFGKISGFPAGNLFFAICSIAAINLINGYVYMPVYIRRFAQMMSGALIGIQFSIRDLILIWESIIPVLTAVLGWLVLNQILGVIMNQWAKIPLTTALFSSSAGGLTDMGIIAAEQGGNPAVITSFQFSRLLSVLLFYPIIIHMVTEWGMV